MNCKARYKLMNQGGVMLMRRFLFFWTDYEPFNNKLVKSEQKMNKLVADFQKELATYHAHRKEQQRIIDDINNSREQAVGMGVPFYMKLSLFPFRKERLPDVSKEWKKVEKALRGGGTLAEEIAGAAGFSIVEVDGKPLGTSRSEGDLALPEFAGSHTYEVKPVRSKNQNNNNNSNNNPSSKVN